MFPPIYINKVEQIHTVDEIAGCARADRLPQPNNVNMIGSVTMAQAVWTVMMPAISGASPPSWRARI